MADLSRNLDIARERTSAFFRATFPRHGVKALAGAMGWHESKAKRAFYGGELTAEDIAQVAGVFGEVFIQVVYAALPAPSRPSRMAPSWLAGRLNARLAVLEQEFVSIRRDMEATGATALRQNDGMAVCGTGARAAAGGGARPELGDPGIRHLGDVGESAHPRGNAETAAILRALTGRLESDERIDLGVGSKEVQRFAAAAATTGGEFTPALGRALVDLRLDGRATLFRQAEGHPVIWMGGGIDHVAPVLLSAAIGRPALELPCPSDLSTSVIDRLDAARRQPGAELYRVSAVLGGKPRRWDRLVVGFRRTGLAVSCCAMVPEGCA